MMIKARIEIRIICGIILTRRPISAVEDADYLELVFEADGAQVYQVIDSGAG